MTGREMCGWSHITCGVWFGHQFPLADAVGFFQSLMLWLVFAFVLILFLLLFRGCASHDRAEQLHSVCLASRAGTFDENPVG